MKKYSLKSLVNLSNSKLLIASILAVVLVSVSACSDSNNSNEIQPEADKIGIDSRGDDSDLAIDEGFLAEIKVEDRAVFISLIQGLGEYIESDLFDKLRSESVTVFNAKNMVFDDFTANYQVRFFDQYTLTGHATKTVKVACESSEYSSQLLLKSEDGELTIRSSTIETQPLDSSQAQYTSVYFYQVDADKVDVNQKVEGQFKRQFNGVAHHQELPFSHDVLHDKNALFLHQSKQFKLEQLLDIDKNNKQVIQFNYISVPEDIDNSEVYNLVELSYLPFSYKQKIFHGYQLLTKHFIHDESGSWVEDGHSVEWMTASGVVLFESFIMPTGLSMQYWLQAVSTSESPKC